MHGSRCDNHLCKVSVPVPDYELTGLVLWNTALERLHC